MVESDPLKRASASDAARSPWLKSQCRAQPHQPVRGITGRAASQPDIMSPRASQRRSSALQGGHEHILISQPWASSGLGAPAFPSVLGASVERDGAGHAGLGRAEPPLAPPWMRQEGERPTGQPRPPSSAAATEQPRPSAGVAGWLNAVTAIAVQCQCFSALSEPTPRPSHGPRSRAVFSTAKFSHKPDWTDPDLELQGQPIARPKRLQQATRPASPSGCSPASCSFKGQVHNDSTFRSMRDGDAFDSRSLATSCSHCVRPAALTTRSSFAF